MDILTFRSFYQTALGEKVFSTITNKLALKNCDVAGERVLGLGYVTPYLEQLKDRAERCFAFMPAHQGACVWPSADKVATALVFEEDLPLSDSAVDRIILIHSLEFAENAREMLSEMWRVLAPNGRIIIVVPNRRGLWARNDHTPFGSGQPYSRQQLLQLLHETNFSVVKIGEALYFSPSGGALARGFSAVYEPLARSFFPYFGGIIVCEAQKRLFQGLLVHRRQSRRVFVPALSPQITNRKSFRAADIIRNDSAN
ncbi:MULTISPECIES: class I SAM-dependent methyltransferase [Bartonella]|uniref:class I SAM-dependent methyltransferase n=1 Tax=Bartonella TaxID=773 RepID=UPI0018DB2A0D|nr:MULTISPECIES: methyltransferase domain-containing protein [Bartonella]MBH9974819.1 methyltransferase domain-containing protein [Bartonella choladocola]MBI0014425.1 methyltransferase domain-containing protein [Bartonella sp. B10834G3]